MTVVATDTRRVLIVDDAEDLRDLLRFGLERSAHLEVVGEAVDGIDAVEQARVLQPDLVFLDVAMPRMDGLQALPLIREAVPHVRVVVLSGFNEGTMAENARRAGADHYVVKGGPLQELVALAESL
jgi:DNA-binding NarL/FixJ family response regulator